MTSGHRVRWLQLSVLAAVLAVVPASSATPSQTSAAQTQPTAAQLTDEQIETFLRKAKLVRAKPASKGITGSLRATMTDGVITHDVHVQTVDITKEKFESRGGVELNFRDSWKLNVAAYRVDRMIRLNMVPVSVPRIWASSEAAYTWWVDDVLMDEAERLKQKLPPPDIRRWNQQMWMVRLFDQLIYNVDRNLGNLVIAKDWRVWPIDHTRAFRRLAELRKPENVTNCDQQVLAGLKELERESLKKALRDYLSDIEIKGILARRDAIVRILETLGPSAIFERSGW
jgi:hypothetical protein